MDEDCVECGESGEMKGCDDCPNVSNSAVMPCSATWSVSVAVDYVDILHISDSGVGGIENISDFKDDVRNCAEQLFAFIGEYPGEIPMSEIKTDNADETADVSKSTLNGLLYCVICKFDKKAFEKHKEAMKGGFYGPPEWDEYKPVMFKDRVSNQWVIECQNCGTHILFHESPCQS